MTDWEDSPNQDDGNPTWRTNLSGDDSDGDDKLKSSKKGDSASALKAKESEGSGSQSSKSEADEKGKLPDSEEGEESNVPWSTDFGGGRKNMTQWVKKNRKNLSIGGGVLGSFIVLALLLVAFFIPYKLTAIIEEITEQVGDTPEYAVERRIEYHLNRYLIIRQLARNGVPGAKDKDFVYLGNGALKTMYVNWQGSDLEVDFFKDGNKLKANNPNASYTNWGRSWSSHIRPANWTLELPDGTPKTLDSREARNLINDYADKTRYKSILKRYHARLVLKKYYGVRSFKWFDKLDDARKGYYEKKRDLKSKLVQNTVGRVSERMGLYLGCMSEGGAAKDCKKKLDKPDAKGSGSIADFDSDEVDDLDDDAKKLVDESDIGPDVDGKDNNALTRALKNQTVRRLITAIGGGIAMAEFASSVEESLSTGVLNLVVYDKNRQTAVAAAAPALSMADQFRSSENFDSDDVRLATELYDGYETSPLVTQTRPSPGFAFFQSASAYDPTKQIRRDCNEDGDTNDKDDLLEPGELVCRDKRLVQDKTAFTDSQGWGVFSTLAEWYRATPVDDIVDIGSEWVQAGLDATRISDGIEWAVDVSGVDSLMENGFAWILNRIAGAPYTGNEEGADRYDATFTGIAAMNSSVGGGIGEDRKDTIGGGYLSNEQVAAIKQEQADQRKYELQQKGFFARYFSPEVKESLTTQVAMATPTSFSAFAQNTVGSITSLRGLQSVGSIFSKDAVAQTPGVINPVHAVYMGFPTDHPIFTANEGTGMSTEEIWDEYECDKPVEKRAATDSFGKPGGLPFEVPTEADPCLLEERAFEAGTKAFDKTYDEGIDDGSSSGSSSSASKAGNTKVYMIGDSITEGMRDAGDIERKYTAAGWDPVVEAEGGENIKWGIDKIKETAAEIKSQNPGTIVVALGTNDSGSTVNAFNTRVDEMMSTIKETAPSAQVYWIDFYGEGQACFVTCVNFGDVFGQFNPALRDKANQHGFTVIPWSESELADEHVNIRNGQGDVHPATGYPEMAQFVVESLGPPPTGGTIAGLESPANLGPEIGNGHYKMPENPEYVFSPNTPESQRCGSKTLVDMIYTVAKAWNAKYPERGKVRVGDLNASAAEHASHNYGVDVDITTEDRGAANTGGQQQWSKDLGRLFADTGIIKVIYYNDNAVQDDFNAYVREKGVSGYMKYWQNHADHFHVRILDEYRTEQSRSCPA